MKKFWLRIFTLVLGFGVMFSCNEPLLEEQDTGKGELKSALKEGAAVSQVIRDRYIVVLKDDVTRPGDAAERLQGIFGIRPGHLYEHALKGFSAYIPEQALNGLQNHPLIDYIESDITVQAFAEEEAPTGIRRIEANNNLSVVDVDVAILDTGIDEDHPDLNVVGGQRFYTVSLGPPKNRGSFSDENFDDDNGHGSHVAGTIGAKNQGAGIVGVAPGARLWAVKVLDSGGSGSMSDIIAGLDWVTARSDIEVVNMSLGGQGQVESFRTAVQNCVASGVVVVVAAGNSGMDVYGNDGVFGTSDDYIPAAYPEAATISAFGDSDGLPGGTGGLTSYGADDSFASFSNFSRSVTSDNPVTSTGAAIDLILPGVDIYSTYMNGGYRTLSGTSMAAPHAAGLAALYIATNGPASDADGVYAIRQALIDAGKTQGSDWGLANGGDPDGKPEHLGWAGLTSPPVTYTITATAGTGGTIDPPGDVIVTEGNDQTFTITPNTGYVISNLVVDDVSIDPVNSYTFMNVTKNHSISAAFAEGSTFSISGTVTETGTGTLLGGATVTITETGQNTTTASDGTYTLSSVPNGTYSITAGKEGYISETREGITVADNNVTGINFSLDKTQDPGTVSPEITDWSVTNTSNPAWKRVSVDWSVSDANGDLQSVVIELLAPDGQTTSTTVAVSGKSATGTNELGIKNGPTGTYTVTLTVTDEAGNPPVAESATKTL